RGAHDVDAESVGLNIQLPQEQRTNRYVRRAMGFYYFFTRKVMLSVSAQAYIFFPGGFGTLDEMFEMLMLIQTKKMSPLPIVLVGRDFWESLFDWSQKHQLPSGYIDPADLKIFKIVDTAEEAFKIVTKSRERTIF
ncbi:hypothetical protein AMJ57_01000, partial [Parcubacteria bacterium SG8_24]